MTTFGFEYEIDSNGPAVLHHLHRLGAVHSDYLHEYHCDCSECDPWDSSVLFTAQTDCTVSAEFPSKVLEWGSDRAEEAFRVMEYCATHGNAGLDYDSGMHVHVAKPYLTRYDGSHLSAEARTSWRLARLFVKYENYLSDIARGARSEVRGYNGTWHVDAPITFWEWDLDGPGLPQSRWGNRGASSVNDFAGGSSLELYRHTDTYEFRLWNATKAAWRMRLAVGLSVAMTAAAADGVDTWESDNRSFLKVVGPYMDDTTIGSLLRQHALTGIEEA